jgi:hypothetical protein
MNNYLLYKYIYTFPEFFPGKFCTFTEQANFYFKIEANPSICSSIYFFTEPLTIF